MIMSRASDDLITSNHANAGSTDPTGEIVRRGKVIAERELQIQALRDQVSKLVETHERLQEERDKLEDEFDRLRAERNELVDRLRRIENGNLQLGDMHDQAEGEALFLKVQLDRYRKALKLVVELI